MSGQDEPTPQRPNREDVPGELLMIAWILLIVALIWKGL